MYMTLQSSPENKEKPPHESSPWQNHSTPWLLCDTCHVYQYSMGGQSLHTPCAQPSCLCNGSVAERWNWSYDRLATSWCHQAIHMVQQMLAPHKIWSSLLSLSNVPVVHRHMNHTEQSVLVLNTVLYYCLPITVWLLHYAGDNTAVSQFVNRDVLGLQPFLITNINDAVVQEECTILPVNLNPWKIKALFSFQTVGKANPVTPHHILNTTVETSHLSCLGLTNWGEIMWLVTQPTSLTLLCHRPLSAKSISCLSWNESHCFNDSWNEILLPSFNVMHASNMCLYFIASNLICFFFCYIFFTSIFKVL